MSGDTAAPSGSKPRAASMYQPSPVDIVVARTMLTRAKQLPPDIVDAIFDHAEYWAHSTNAIDYVEEHQSTLRINSGRLKDRFLIRSVPIGLTHLDDRSNLAETLAYDTNEAKPIPLAKEHDPEFFTKLARYPTPKLEHPVRKVVFTIKSKDQGWLSGGSAKKGTYMGSCTWFEAGLERFDADQACEPHCTGDLRYNSPKSPAPSLPMCALRPIQPEIKPSGGDDGQFQYDHPLHHQRAWEIQRNKVATREWQHSTVTWSWRDNTDPESDEAAELDQKGRGAATGTGEFVRSLKLGDVVTVWGKARYGGWVNNVEKVRMDIYWAV